jgi:hypothetical protein
MPPASKTPWTTLKASFRFHRSLKKEQTFERTRMIAKGEDQLLLRQEPLIWDGPQSWRKLGDRYCTIGWDIHERNAIIHECLFCSDNKIQSWK